MTIFELGIVALPLIGVLIGIAVEARHGFIAVALGALAGGVIGFLAYAVMVVAIYLLSWTAEQFDLLKNRFRH